MAPKRQQKRGRTGESSSAQPQQQPQQHPMIEGMFMSERARREYTDWICSRKFVKERGLEIDLPATWQWENFLKEPEPGIASVVQEFYANAGDTMDRNVSVVRGIEVNFSPEGINNYYGTPNQFRFGDYYHNDLGPTQITESLIESIPRFFNPDARWNIVHGNRVHVNYDVFRKHDRAIIDFVKARLKPNLHRGQIQTEIVYLTYCIRAQKTINIGARICEEIKAIASSGGKNRTLLSFPSLITGLCRNARVPIPQRNIVKVPVLPMLTREYVEKHYHDGDLQLHRGGQEQQEEEEDEQQGSMEAAHNYSPMDFDQGYVNSRWEEFYRESREQWEEQRGYNQRLQDVAYFTAHSQHQHNQAALGYPPSFPTLPPWCTDPQYMPWHMRQPPPPPPQ